MNRLNQSQRYQIEALLKTIITQKRIAEILGVSETTISRELSRNRGLKGYRAKQAHRFALERQSNIPKVIHFTDKIKKQVKRLIKKDYSPEQIVGHFQKNKMDCVSHQSIYQYILEDKLSGGNLFTHLRHGEKRKKKRYGSKDTRGQIRNKISIDDRPSIVDEKEEVGHWEIDLVVSAGRKNFLVTAVERVTKITLIGHSKTKESISITTELIRMLIPYKAIIHTITADNGKEFAGHEEISKVLNTKFYFAHPYHSWERGLNENTNGLIRQYLPKGESMKHITQKDCDRIALKLNRRPRKCLNMETPEAVYVR